MKSALIDQIQYEATIVDLDNDWVEVQRKGEKFTRRARPRTFVPPAALPAGTWTLWVDETNEAAPCVKGMSLDGGAVSGWRALTGNFEVRANDYLLAAGTQYTGYPFTHTGGIPHLNADFVKDGSLSIAKTYGLQTALEAKAALAGSISQSFAAATLTTNSYGGITCSAYSSSGSVIPWDSRVDIKGWLRVIGLSSGWANIDCGMITFDTYTIRSDERLKRSIAPIKAGSGLAAIVALAQGGVIEYNLHTDGAKQDRRLGLSAQAVAAHAPHASTRIAGIDLDDAPLLGVDQGALLALAVDAIAALAARVVALEGAGR